MGQPGGSWQIYGSPSTAGIYTFAVHIEDAIGHALDHTITATVAQAPPPPPPTGGGSGGGSTSSALLLLLAAAALRRKFGGC